MSRSCRSSALVVLFVGLIGCERTDAPVVSLEPNSSSDPSAFAGSKAGEEKVVGGVKLCWCPAGKFTMGSPRDEPERRPGEDQVEVTLTKGFWMAKYETTQGDWKRFG